MIFFEVLYCIHSVYPPAVNATPIDSTVEDSVLETYSRQSLSLERSLVVDCFDERNRSAGAFHVTSLGCVCRDIAWRVT